MNDKPSYDAINCPGTHEHDMWEAGEGDRCRTSNCVVTVAVPAYGEIPLTTTARTREELLEVAKARLKQPRGSDCLDHEWGDLEIVDVVWEEG